MTELSVQVSDEIAEALKAFLAEQGEQACDLSTFVENTIRERLFRETVKRIQDRNAKYDQQEILDTVHDAVKWARDHRP